MPPQPETKEDLTHLTVHCGGFFSRRMIRCQASLDFIWEVVGSRDRLWRALLEKGWVLSQTSDPNDWRAVVAAPLCPGCTRKIYGDEFYIAVMERLRGGH